MLEVNLLPGGNRKKVAAAGPSIDYAALAAGLKARLGDLWTVVPILLIVVGLGAGGYLYYRQGNDRTVAEGRLEKAKEDSVRYAKVVTQRNAAMAKRDTLLRQVNLIRAIDDDRYIWPHIMEEVSKALPNYVWISIMNFAGTPQGATNVVALPPAPKIRPKPGDTTKVKKPTVDKPPVVETSPPRDQVLVRLMGRTVDIQAMTRFIADLESSPFFGSVYLNSTTPSNESGVDYYQFQLNIPYTRPDSLAVRRAPLTSMPRR